MIKMCIYYLSQNLTGCNNITKTGRDYYFRCSYAVFRCSYAVWTGTMEGMVLTWGYFIMQTGTLDVFEYD